MAAGGSESDAELVHKCAELPFEDAVDLFFPTSEGGQLLRTRSWPGRDSHAEARNVCRECPALASCLEGALDDDAWTFRGGMSAEERAVFGGFRDRDTRKRPLYLTASQVAARLRESGIDVAQVGQVLASWQHSSKTVRQVDQDRPDEETSSPSGQGPVQLGDASTLERLADVALGEWRQRRVS